MVNLGHLKINSLNPEMVILLAGLYSKIRLRMESSSADKGRMDLRNFGSFMYARKVVSSKDARFHGLRPQVRFTRITPSDHTSFGADA